MVFVTGPDAVGKTTFTRNFAKALNARDVHTQIIHLDDFHNPRAVRYAPDRPQFAAYLSRSFDFDRLIDCLLKPIKSSGHVSRRLSLLDLASDAFVAEREYCVTPASVVLVEGVFLLQERLKQFSDFTIYLDAPLEECFRRGVTRDHAILGEQAETRYLQKYMPAQAIHRRLFPPSMHADIVIDSLRVDATSAVGNGHAPRVLPPKELEPDWRCEAVIFDLWDTLVPLPQASKEGAQHRTAQVLGLPRAEFNKFWGASRRRRETGPLEDYLAEVCRDLGIAEKDETIAQIIAARSEYHGKCFATPRADAVMTLKSLRALGMRTAVVSNCTSDVHRMIAESELEGLVDHVVTSNKCGAMKPEPEIYRTAADLCGVAPQNCLYVGDGNDDELPGAIGAKMQAVLLETSAQINWQGPRIDRLSDVLALAFGERARPFLSQASA